jgi:hypothetical protein
MPLEISGENKKLSRFVTTYTFFHDSAVLLQSLHRSQPGWKGAHGAGGGGQDDAVGTVRCGSGEGGRGNKGDEENLGGRAIKAAETVKAARAA